MDGIRQSPIHRGSETASACAGNTRHSRYAKPYPRNYLRTRGEYIKPRSVSPRMMELPPRTRRIRPSLRTLPDMRGTTSAYAENTPVFSSFHLGFWNYLRVRGEYPSASSGRSGSLELPPRTRRILAKYIIDRIRTRTTSAYAENT